MMKQAVSGKKKILIALAIAACVLGICTAAGYGMWKQYKEERAFSYEVYDDHVELVQYTGNAKHVRVPDTLEGKPVTVIKEKCFDHNKKVQTVYLGRNIKTIGEVAFRSCDSLEQVRGEAELEVISRHAFAHCYKLTRLEAGSRMKRIELGAFYECKQLDSIGKQPELEYIGYRAFFDTGLLMGFEVPEHTQVEEEAFNLSRWHSEQEFVIFRGTLLSYNGPETGETERRMAAEVVEVPYGVKKIEYCALGAYSEHGTIEEIYLPETVTEVESFAFGLANDYRIYIPDSVTSIGQQQGGKWTIVTTSGSYAEEYAKQYGLKCEIVEPWW